MSGVNCHMLALPEDILLLLFESWLDLKDVVKLDSAICEYTIRPAYLKMLAKCTLHCNYGTYLADEYIHWRTSRNLKKLNTLVVRKVSESFVGNCTHAADVLIEVKRLIIVWPDGDSFSRWLKLVTPMFQNLSVCYTSGLRFDDIGWIPQMGKLETLEALHLHFAEKGYDVLQQDMVLHHFRNCHKLQTLELYNYYCNGIESILANNTNLLSLDLNKCGSMTDESFTQILNLPYVQHIDLSGNDYVVGDGALNITTTTLRFLSLAYFHRLTEDNLLRILAALPNKPIVDLRLAYMKRITAATADRCEQMCLNDVYIMLSPRYL